MLLTKKERTPKFLPKVSMPFVLCVGALIATRPAQAADPLPSWNEGPAKHAIIEFVRRSTSPGGKDFLPEADRIATFDNDGTLWLEQPIYTQVAFGNSTGDQEMLEWTQSAGGAVFMVLVHHDDAAREFAYGPESKIGTFSDALMNEAKTKG